MGNGLFHCVVVGTDGSSTADEALHTAIKLARLCRAHLHVVSAYRAPATQAVEALEDSSQMEWALREQSEVRSILGAARASADADGVAVQVHAVIGDPVDAILDTAEQVRADVIVVGNKGMAGLRRLIAGSVPDKVARRAGCAVLIAHTTGAVYRPADD
jgi:nucleotide-binding universal stress UspA family protein